MKPQGIAPDARTELFGGTGTVLVWDLLGAPPISPFAAVLACELEPGGSVGDHVQEHFPEIVVCVSGDGAARVNGVAHAMQAGTVVQLQLGHTLAFTNHSSAEPLSYLIIKAAGAQR